jgi:hypothetical protein
MSEDLDSATPLNTEKKQACCAEKNDGLRWLNDGYLLTK